MRQCGRVLNGRVSIGEYTFAREYRGKSGYRPGACVPALELTRYSEMVIYTHHMFMKEFNFNAAEIFLKMIYCITFS